MTLSDALSIKERIFALGYDAIAIAGPTASGKTGLSVALAEILSGEIISCDSMQIYKGMDIATAKVTDEEMRGIPHHLIDICPLDRLYSAADYVTDATRAVREIRERGKLPIFCGGTGLYLESVMRGEYPESSECDTKLRDELFAYAREHGNKALHDMLRLLDSESADAIHENNVKRVVRAIEIIRSSGQKKSELDREHSEMRGPRILSVYLCFEDRELLYSRIDRRVDMMVEAGIVAELEGLMADAAFMSNSTATQAIGYKELFCYLRGESTLDECIEVLKRATRRYAKRQLTWFSHRDYMTALSVDEGGRVKPAERLVRDCLDLIERLVSK